MGEIRYFWRADCRGETIATGYETKAECIKEVRVYLRQKANGNGGNKLPRETLVAFAKAAIKELGLSSKDGERYIKGVITIR